MTNQKCLEIANEINKLMDEFKDNMPEDKDVILSWEFASCSLQSLWHRVYHYETKEIWFNTPKEETGIEL